MTDYNSVLHMIADLNQQIKNFESLKSEHESRKAEFLKKEEKFSSLATEAAGALEAVASLIGQNKDLSDHILSLKNAFVELSKRPGKEHLSEVVITEQGQNANESEVEEPVAKMIVPVEHSQQVENTLGDQTTESDQEILVSATFPEASHVELALEPWNWESKPMEKHEDGWQTRARLPSGNGVLFKFIVDGEWRCSEQYPIVKDNTFENNYIGCM